MIECSIIIPVHNHADLTRRCLDALLALGDARIGREVIVVDDGSEDATATMLRRYGERIRIVSLDENRGFAGACNAGAVAAGGAYLIFLNNDTIPQRGWLDALLDYARVHPEAGVVGSKLLYPDGSVQHAGVAIGQDRYPRHLYVGFPGDHPAVNRSRRYPIVTAACVCVGRAAFDACGGFDVGYRNGFEDVDLCLRLGALGYEVHYCHRSVLTHLESASRDDGAGRDDANRRIYEERWRSRVTPDELAYYAADGLLTFSDTGGYPMRLAVSPLLAVLETEQHDREVEDLLSVRSKQVFALMKETLRLTMRIEELESGADVDERSPAHREFADLFRAREALQRYVDATRAPNRTTDEWAARAIKAVSTLSEGGNNRDGHIMQRDVLRHDEAIQTSLLSYQAGLATRLAPMPARAENAFAPGKYLVYQQLVRRIRERVTTLLPIHATIIVISKGDDALVQFPARIGWHFPQTEAGTYAGYHPRDGAAAIAELEALRAKGGEYLLFPATAYWWLDHYGAFRDYLEAHYALVHTDEDACRIYALGDDAAAAVHITGATQRQDSLARQIRALAESVLPRTATVILIDDGVGLALDGAEMPVVTLAVGAEDAGDLAPDASAMIAQCEALRAQGATYLIMPSTVRAGDDGRIPALHDYLTRRYRMVVQQEHLCTIFALEAQRGKGSTEASVRRKAARIAQGGAQ